MSKKSVPSIDKSLGEMVLSSHRRANAFNRTLKSLEALEFPYAESQDALSRVSKSFKRSIELFEASLASEHPAIARSGCSTLNATIAKLHVVLGCIIRSTHTRNAFEIYDPLWRLAKSLLGKEACLVLSSEWEYIPFAYPFSYVDGVVFVGMPAAEAGCILFTPLAGHELGHAVWRQRRHGEQPEGDKTALSFRLGMELEPNFDNAAAYARAHRWAIRQLEELFCDMIGFYTFGEAYLRAFAYVTVPGTEAPRSPRYPALIERAKYLWASAKLFRDDIPDIDFSIFQESKPSTTTEYDKELSIADAAVAKFYEEIRELAKIAVGKTALEAIAQPVDKRISIDFMAKRPSGHARTLADVTRACWEAFDEISNMMMTQKNKVSYLDQLDEVALKTIEVNEHRMRLEG